MIFIYFLFIFTFFLQKAPAGRGGSTLNFKSDSKGPDENELLGTKDGLELFLYINTILLT